MALHPSYLYAYAPGFVLNEEPEMSYRVQFYDGQVVSELASLPSWFDREWVLATFLDILMQAKKFIV